MAKLRTFGIAYVALALFGCGSDDSSTPALVEPIQDIAPSTPAELSNFINSIIKPENEDAAQVYTDKLKSGSIQETQQAATDILAYAQNNLQVRLCCVIQFRDRAARFGCFLVNTTSFRHT